MRKRYTSLIEPKLSSWEAFLIMICRVEPMRSELHELLSGLRLEEVAQLMMVNPYRPKEQLTTFFTPYTQEVKVHYS